MEFLIALDKAVFVFINSTLSHPWLDSFFPIFTDLHKNPAFLALLVLFVWAFVRAYGKRGWLVTFAFLISCASTDFITTRLLKHQVERPRPFATEGLAARQVCSAGGFSFPSNHAANTFSAAVFLSFFLISWAPWLFALAALTAYSRVYCGVHFPADVLAGAAWGALLGFILARFAQALIFGRREKT